MGIKGSTLVLLASLAVFNLKSDAKLFSQTFPESSKCLLIDSTILSTKYSPEKRNADMFGSHEHAKSKLDYLKPEMEKYCGKTGDVAYDYFKTSFDSVYIGKIDSLPEAKERVGAFLLWLSKKPGLFEEFIKDCNDGKVEFTVHVSDYEDIRSSLAVFGFWTGMKYAGETIVKKLSSTRASKINIIESNISGSVVVPCRDDTAYTAYFGRIKGLDAPEQSIVAGVTIGIHEGAHCLNRSGFLSESAAAFLQDMLGLPVPLLESLKNEGNSDIFQAGRRDFYDIYLKSSPVDPVSSKSTLQWMMNEYPEFAVHSWIKSGVKIWRLPHMQWSETCDFLKSMSMLKNELGTRVADPIEIAEEICKRYCIEDKTVEDSLSSAFSKLKKFEREKTRSNKEFLDAFVRYMNQSFGKPGTEIWREFTLLENKNEKNNGLRTG